MTDKAYITISLLQFLDLGLLVWAGVYFGIWALRRIWALKSGSPNSAQVLPLISFAILLAGLLRWNYGYFPPAFFRWQESLPFVLPFSCVALVLIWLGKTYGAKEQDASSASGWLGFASVLPEELGEATHARLALASVAGLFVELLLIRWMTSEISVFAYFKNFVLISCFLGFGLGCFLCRRRISLPAAVVPLLTLVSLISWPSELRDVLINLHLILGTSTEVQIWGIPTMPIDRAGGLGLVFSILLTVPLFMLVCYAMVPLGQAVGWQLEKAAKGIRAYSANILGSLAGVALFTWLSYLWTPPAVWFAVAGVLMAVLFWRRPKAVAILVIAYTAMTIVTAMVQVKDAKIYWSPYQKLTVRPRADKGEIIAYEISTNESWYQRIANLSSGFIAAHPQLFTEKRVRWNAYNVPYHFYPDPPRVLVLGAGTGNDVAAALRNGAGVVTAVEIDPLILDLGRKLHFEKPYASSKVRVVLNDARSYVETTNDRYDLIVFSLLDSHTTSSNYSNIRIDNYVYTREALAQTARLLAPNGVMIVKFWVSTPWIAGRLDKMMTETFHRPPLQFQTELAEYETAGRFFVAGSREQIQKAIAEPELAAFLAAHREVEMSFAPETTDDWPYLYQREPGIPLLVYTLTAAVLFVSLGIVQGSGAARGRIRWHFFFLGGGFLLLEAQIISRTALLFGTTWVVNSIIISALLLLIVASNLLAEWTDKIGRNAAYAGLFCALAISYFIPLRWLFFDSILLKAAAAALVLCLPVFFAGIIFIRSFAAAGFTGESLGSNLMGAVTGGVLESLSLWFGIKSMVLLAAAFYLASALSMRSAPQGLEREVDSNT